jgi:hypothetical protein
VIQSINSVHMLLPRLALHPTLQQLHLNMEASHLLCCGLLLRCYLLPQDSNCCGCPDSGCSSARCSASCCARLCGTVS